MNILLNVKEVDVQLKEEIYMSGCNRDRDCTIIRHCSNYNEFKYNARICKKDEEMSNVYSFN